MTDAFLSRMAKLSGVLLSLIDDAGIKRGDGIRLVTRLAKTNGLRDWPATRNEADYKALIRVLKEHLQN